MLVDTHGSIPMRLDAPVPRADDHEVSSGYRTDSETRSNLTQPDESAKTALSDEQGAVVAELAKRDREVRAHEQAHASAGGQYTSSPSYDYQRGPNGQLYAVGGEVAIDTSPIAGDPEATLEKAQIIQQAATAPSQPSSEDRRVAAVAAAMASQARAEIAQQNINSQSEAGQFIDFHA